MAVIGLDFGNYKTFTSFISDMDESTRRGGNVHDLLPGKYNSGIPSVYFYGKDAGVLTGENAVRAIAKPLSNRLRYLKNRMGKTVTLDDRTVSCDEAITAVIQHCVRSANKELQSGWMTTTDQISLAYPASFTFAQLEHLISLAEKATLEDGRNLRVVGTIREPAAAALDYLATYANSNAEQTVLCYDLGGGTFDLALVALYPQGRTSKAGNKYYYDIIDTAGLNDVGGVDFDEITGELLLSKTTKPLNERQKEIVRNGAEQVKIELSGNNTAEIEVYDSGSEEYINLRVTRDEFEKASAQILKRTVDLTIQMINKHREMAPALILLTGGASQMPMVKNALEIALPSFKGKVAYYRPEKAISYGAARYGTVEENTDPVIEIFNTRVDKNIGVKFFDSYDDKTGHISVYIDEGTSIPYTSDWHLSETAGGIVRTTNFSVFEANKLNADRYQPDRDYTEIMKVSLDFGKLVQKGKCETRLIVDKLGLLTIEVREANVSNPKMIRKSIELKNLGR